MELLTLDNQPDNVIALKVNGPVDQASMMQMLGQISQITAQCKKARVYMEVEKIGGIEIDAVIEKIKFMFATGLSAFERAAVVTDKGWMQKIVGLEDAMFKSIELKAFSFDDADKAKAFIVADTAAK